jgi:acetylglutamate kinase
MTAAPSALRTHTADVASAELSSKAAVLAEALPWLEEFAGSTVVIKYGGHAMSDPDLQQSFASDVVFLRRVGLRPVIVHGGGPQIGAMLKRLGVDSHFVAGLRVTTPEAMDVVRMVLTGQVQRDVVSQINRHGPLAVGMSGEDAHLFTARHLVVGEPGSDIDLGQVGELTAVDGSFVGTVLDDGLIPVVSSVARGADGSTFNINADTAAAALAVELGAHKLVILTDVAGVYANWPDTTEVLSQLSVTELRDMTPSLASGMIPKLTACLDAVTRGVPQAHILDGRIAHSVLLEIFTNQGLGTLVVADGEEP